MEKYVLGLDISTSKIGLCIMDFNYNLIESEVIKLDTSQQLEERCIFLENYIGDKKYLLNLRLLCSLVEKRLL